jgi:hypothetical protein
MTNIKDKRYRLYGSRERVGRGIDWFDVEIE